MRVFYVSSSRTAEPPRGHFGAIGARAPRLNQSHARAPGHRAFSGTPRAHMADRQAEAVAEIKAERARRAVWADCERRPLSIDKDLK